MGSAGPLLLAATKMDEPDEAVLGRLVTEFHELQIVPTSILDEASLERLKHAIWQLTGLMRVYVRHGEVDADQPLALPVGATVLKVARAIHSDLVRSFRSGRVWGSSAKFEGQQVGRDHLVQKGDTVEIIAS